MRILNEDTDKKLEKVTLYVTMEEASDLVTSLEMLIKKPKGNHTHIDFDDYKSEFTVCIYDEKNLDEYGFNDRSKKLILENE